MQGIGHGQNLEGLLIYITSLYAHSTARYHSIDLTEFNANICDRLYCLAECTMVPCVHMDNPNEIRFAMDTSYTFSILRSLASVASSAALPGWLLKTTASAE